MDDFYDLTKKIPIIHVPPSTTNGEVIVCESSDEDGGCLLSDDDDDFSFVTAEREKSEALFQGLANSISNPGEGAMSALTSFEGIENLKALDNDDTQKLFDKYSFDKRAPNVLPIDKYREEIIDSIAATSVTLVHGATGCGKTTRIPQFILDHHYEIKKNCNILVTQPRRLAAVSIARRVCEERGWEVGSICGYQIALNQKLSPDTRLTYCTVGIYLKKLLTTRDLSEYTHIILDEVHERSQDLDFVLLMLRQLLCFSNTKVLLMSATMDMTPFIEYFKSAPTLKRVEFPIPLPIEILGDRMFPVEIRYLDDLEEPTSLCGFEEDTAQFSEHLANVCAQMIRKMDRFLDTDGDPKGVLIFLPGLMEIEIMHSILVKQSSMDKDLHRWHILPLHSSIPHDQQARVLQKMPPAVRKIILATNIAESSITVPDIEYIFDFCLTKRLRSLSNGLSCLALEWAPKHSCIQRAGRVGRVRPGRVYRLLPKAFYRKLPSFMTPDILVAPLEKTVLQAKMLEIGEPLTVLSQAIDPPRKRDVKRAVLTLKEVGALLLTSNGRYHPSDGDLTFLGRIMSNLPLDVKSGKLVALGHVFGVLEECIIIAAALSLRNIFAYPLHQKLNSYVSMVSWAYGSCSDHIAILNAYEAYKKESVHDRITGPDDANERQWAKSMFLNYRSLREMEVLIQEITYRLKENTIESLGRKYQPWNKDERITIVKFAIAGAFYPNYFVTKSNEEEEVLRELGGRDPFSTVLLSNFPSNKHPGPLYAGQIQKLLEPCRNEMRISFEPACEKVFVQFKPPFEENSETFNKKKFLSRHIPVSMYIAIMMRRLNRPLEIRLFPPYVVSEYSSEFNLDSREVLPGSFQKLVPEEDALREPSNLPSVGISTISLVILKLIDPGHFMATDAIGNHDDIYSCLESAINSHKHVDLTTDPVQGALYLFRNTDSRWCRARVERYFPQCKDVDILFIDYGDRKRVLVKDLKLPNENCKDIFIGTPAYTFECRLAHLEPSTSLSHQRQWSEDAREFFISITRNSNLFGSVYSVVNGVVRIELMATFGNPPKNINVNKLLIEKKFAQPAVEGYASQKNNQHRTKELDLNLRVAYDEAQRSPCWVPQRPIKTPDLKMSNRTVSLRGPRSPLEMKITSLKSSEGLNANISSESMNAVILNEWPEDPRSTLLVSSHVTQSESGNSLLLTHTTLMPDVPGLPAIMSLLFSPRVQYRLNSIGTRFTSAICGLGLGDDDHPIYREHDFDVIFDVAFTLDDLQTINNIRVEISKLLYTESGVGFPTYSRSDLLDAMKRMRYSFDKLLCSRPGQTPVFPKKSCRWTRHFESQIEVDHHLGDLSTMIYPPHPLLAINNEDDIMAQLQEFISIITLEKPFTPKFCPLCEEHIQNYSALLKHVNTVKHRQNEDGLRVSVK